MKHFEQPNIVVIEYGLDKSQLDCEYCYTIDEAIKYAKRSMLIELKKCKERFPLNPMVHTIAFCEIHDNLNRGGNWKVVINENETFIIT